LARSVRPVWRAAIAVTDDSHTHPRAGNEAEVGPLVEEVYGELRRIADRYVQREKIKSVQATELVHEAYLRLLKDRSPAWRNRTHFLAIAAISMRRLLVERARARAAAKRGGGHIQVTLDERLLAREDEAVDILAVDRALEALGKVDPQQAQLVELRFFGGLSVEETAEAMGISPATVKRHWAVARAWLWREIEGGRPT
jgi:RNA polymerase sigma factor (TIGR02999 family)